MDIVERLYKRRYFSDNIMTARTPADEELIDSMRKERIEAAAEITRLRAELSTIRAETWREVIEAAAKWHDGQIAELEQQIERNNEYMIRSGHHNQSANEYCKDEITRHRLAAAAIRALPEPKP